jgi:hypothetical protein
VIFKNIPIEQLVEFKAILDHYLILRQRQTAQQKLQVLQNEIEGLALELAEVNGQLTVQDELVNQLQATVDIHSPLVALSSHPGAVPPTVSKQTRPTAAKLTKRKVTTEVDLVSAPPGLMKDEATA